MFQRCAHFPHLHLHFDLDFHRALFVNCATLLPHSTSSAASHHASFITLVPARPIRSNFSCHTHTLWPREKASRLHSVHRSMPSAKPARCTWSKDIPQASSQAIDDHYDAKGQDESAPLSAVDKLCTEYSVENTKAYHWSRDLYARFTGWEANGRVQKPTTNLPDSLKQEIVAWFISDEQADSPEIPIIKTWMEKYTLTYEQAYDTAEKFRRELMAAAFDNVATIPVALKDWMKEFIRAADPGFTVTPEKPQFLKWQEASGVHWSRRASTVLRSLRIVENQRRRGA